MSSIFTKASSPVLQVRLLAKHPISPLLSDLQSNLQSNLQMPAAGSQAIVLFYDIFGWSLPNTKVRP